MTISELGSIGEFLGSIVVVVSVLYLAYQLKQTQAAITLNALQSRASGQIAEATSLYNSEHLPQILLKIADQEELSREEEIRYLTWQRAYHRLHELTLLQSTSGHIEPWAMEEVRISIRLVVGQNARTMAYWNQRKMIYAPQYQAFVDSILEEIRSADQ